MSFSELKLNRVERVIFGLALGIGGLLVLIRIVIFVALLYSHHAG
jgi:hypothetical protein